MFLTAVRANNLCKKERQNLSLLRATPVGKHIEPELAHESAIRLVDCFQKMYPFTQLQPSQSNRYRKKKACPQLSPCRWILRKINQRLCQQRLTKTIKMIFSTILLIKFRHTFNKNLFVRFQLSLDIFYVKFSCPKKNFFYDYFSCSHESISTEQNLWGQQGNRCKKM